MVKTLIISLSLTLIITSCNAPVRPVKVKIGKPGGLYEINEVGKAYTLYNKSDTFRLDTTSFIRLSEFQEIQQEQSDFEGLSVLNFKLNTTAASKFESMTKRNIRKQLCLVVGDKIISAPMIQSAISNGRVSLQIDVKTANAIIQLLEN